MKKNPQTLPQKQTKRQKTKEKTDQKQMMAWEWSAGWPVWD